tara:strand:+ start:1516 stop:2103 length:588 start_codon:yes stop_codon:yes gene_type:complete
MKKIIIILLFLLNLQSLSRADDISDFEIEGMSIGDSLLDIFSKKEIDSIEPTYYPNSKKFHDVPVISSQFKNYDQITFGLKKNDERYIIYSLAGQLYFENDFDNCIKKKKEIIKDLSSLFSKQERHDYTHTFGEIDDGKSFSEVTDFEFKDKSLLRIYCTNWTLETEKKRGFFDMLAIDATSEKYMKWLDNEAYK